MVGAYFLIQKFQVFSMPGKNGRKNSTKFKTPAMKKWQKNHLKQEIEEPANSTSEVVTHFLVPAFVTFCFFLIIGTFTAGDPPGYSGKYGEAAACGMTMIAWPLITLIFILYHNSKGNENGKNR